MTFPHFGQVVLRDARTFSILTFRDFTSLAPLAPTFLCADGMEPANRRVPYRRIGRLHRFERAQQF
jgi:hypothetical protein